MSNWAFVTISFGLSWLVLIGYTVLLNRRQARAVRLLVEAQSARVEPRRQTRTERAAPATAEVGS
jgi:hypothetical protein